MSVNRTRRAFLRDSALVGAGLWAAGRSFGQPTTSANEKLNIAVIGTNGRGRANLNGVKSQNIVVLCDVDENQAAGPRKDFPNAKFIQDYRRVLDEKNIDAVVVSTPDHIHAPAALLALKAGKHVYSEKPLTHNVYEARLVSEAAKKAGVATQMGTQIHAGSNYRRVVELVKTNAIGTVREVHVFVGGAWSGNGRPAETPPVPPSLNWDLWLGPAPERPYNPAYHPASWRGYWDFGGGTLADMACHHVDLPFWALDLRCPLTIEAEGPEVSAECAPKWAVIRYEFAARGQQPPVKLTWHQGDRRPPQFKEGLLPEWGNGTLFVGEKGMLLADYDKYVLLPKNDFEGFQPPKPFIPESIGHHEEWIEACKTGKPTTCNFDYAGALTECVLLGNVSYRSGRRLEWDPKNLRIPNAPEAEKFLRRESYRKGWELPA
jgi:predicted dehydrogenase